VLLRLVCFLWAPVACGARNADNRRRSLGLQVVLLPRQKVLQKLLFACAGTVQNRLYVMINWTLALVFGRDVSRW
jgi:hypothetical protein